MKKLKYIVVAMFLLANFFQFAAADLPSGIDVSLRPTQTGYRAADAISVEVTYKNVTNEPIRLLTWGTALEGQLTENFLNVSFQGRALPYIGPHVKRLPPTENDYIELAPQQAVSANVDINAAYPMFEKGTYEIAYKGFIQSFKRAGSKSSASMTLELTEDRPVLLLRRTPNIDSSCNATQRAQINQALTIAERIAITARNALSNAPVASRPGARRYTEWFGQHSSGRYATAQTAFNRIASALSTRTIGFDCTCNISNRDRTFAFVFPNDPFNMNVCPVFFRVAPSGTDSRSGTIIHEISHFTVVAATDDFPSALDQRGSRALANSNPSAAIRNANAFEYFAENTPFLSMPTASTTPPPEPEPEPEPEPVPDLIVNSVGTSDQNPTTGDEISVLGVVANQGDAASTASLLSIRLSSDAQITTSDPQIAQGSVPTVAAGSTINFQIAALAPDEDGQFWIGACVAPVNGELLTTNNCSAAVPLTVERRIVIPPILFLLLSDDE